MKSRLVIVAVVALLGCGIFSGAALAEEVPDPFSFTLMGGGYVFEGLQNLDDGPLYALALGYHFDENWGAETVFNFVDSEHTIGAERDVDVYSVRLDFLYNFLPGQKLDPYVAAGLGAIFTRNFQDEDSALFNYGIGLKYFLSKNLALRGDLRHILDIHVGEGDREHDLFNHLSYSVGLTWHFGSMGEEVRSWDLDEDGIANSYDRCPDTPVGVPVDSLGCPK